MKTAIEELVSRQTEDTRLECPTCSPERKHRNTKTLSVTVRPHEILYKCHHCDEAGAIRPEKLNIPVKPFKKKVSQIATAINNDNAVIEKFFAGRGITFTDMSKLPAMTIGHRYFDGHGKLPAIGFVYGSVDQPDAIKWRALEVKAFTQQNAARSFYGLDRLEPGAKEIVIVEGEADAVALASIGIVALSCPNGAPMKVSAGKISPEEDVKFQYLWEARDIFDAAEKVVLACDGDPAGDALTEEIARRIGRERTHRAQYPEGCKDITDVIREHGPVVARQVIDGAELMPLVGVYDAKDYSKQLHEIFHKGLGKGESTGFESVDELWSISPGRLSVITGQPNSGKSSFVDHVMMNLAKNADWKFAVASFENPPSVHLSKLAEIHTAKPFYTGPNPRMTESDLNAAMDFISKHFVFLESRDGSLPTIDSLLQRCKAAILRLGVRGLVIDPYNFLDLGKSESEHQAINTMLTKVTSFAKAHDVHVFFVAHPAKIYPRDDGSMPVVKGVHVSGSSAWFAKTDFGITVHRNHGKGPVEIHCWKARFKWEGQQGMCRLGFDVLTGRYHEVEAVEDVDLDDLEF